MCPVSRAYRLAAAPVGAKKLAIGYLIGRMPALEKALVAALPGHVVALTEDGSPYFTTDDHATACKLAGLKPSTPTGLFGWSAGCQPVRQAIMANAVPNLAWIACFDGTASSFPTANTAHINAWADVMSRARRGEMRAIFTCTGMTYVERLTIEHGGQPAFMATKHVIELALGKSYDESCTLEVGKPVVDGGLYAEQFQSAANGQPDAHAHEVQVHEVAPHLLGMLIGVDTAPASAWWADHLFESIKDSLACLVAEVFHPLSDGEKALAWCEAELAAGVKESPPGSNDGPRVREYFIKPTYLRNGAPLRVSNVAWCAAAQSMAHFECGIEIPAFVSGVEFETWAKASGHAADATYKAQPGDLVIFHRPGVGWERHVTRFRKYLDDVGNYETIAGNESPSDWQVSKHPPFAQDKAFSSIVRIVG